MVSWMFEKTLHKAVDKMRKYRPDEGLPHIADGGEHGWQVTPDGVWTGGFWVGLLWISWAETHEDDFVRWASQGVNLLAASVGQTPNHDLGMMFCPSAVSGWQLQKEDSWRLVALQAARSLASQFNEAARMIPGWGFFGGDDWKDKALVDTLMNVPLLLWAAESSDDDRLRAVALAHARRSITAHIRADGSTAHVVQFDPITGAIRGEQTYQGASGNSCWSRGQAWAMAGLTAMAAHVSDPALGEAARTVSHYFDVQSQGNIPPWDFSQRSGPPDASAAAIASYAFLRLAQVTQENEWRDRGLRLLEVLVNQAVADQGQPFILAHQTADYPHGLGIDGGTVYGDYFFVRALQLALNRPFPECF